MNERYFPDWIDAYLKYSSFTEAPEHVRFWTAVSTIAGAMGRKVWIDQYAFKWFPNHFIILVGPPDVISKSTTMKMGMNLLKQVPDFKLGPSSGSWQAIIKTMADEFCQDWDLGGEKIETLCDCTISVTELGNFLKTKDTDFMDVMIGLWDGDTINKKLIKEGGSVFIENPLLNMNGCTTPSWISLNISEHMLEGGLLSRVIFIYADKVDHPVPYPADVMPKDILVTEGRLVEDLAVIHHLKGPMTLSTAAKSWASEWYNNMKSTSGQDEKQRDRITRKQTHAHKLAMVLSVARSNSGTIEIGDIQRAVKEIDALSAYRETIIASVGKTVEANIADQVCGFVRSRKTVSEKEVYRKVHAQIPTLTAFMDLMNGLEKAGFFKRVPLGNDIEVRWMQ